MRYFIISYMFGVGSLGTGTFGYIGKTYPSIYELKKSGDNLNIMSIMEVNEDDYNSFWHKES